MVALRFGIVGTGSWAQHSHIPAAAGNASVDFVGAVGRDVDFDNWLDSVDAVGFAVPPDVQSALALRAIAAGKHVLLDKPIATDARAAQRLAEAAEATGVGSIVFTTKLFIEPIARWVEALKAQGGWTFGRAEMISAALAGMPNPGWRADRGGLWDLGPHALSFLLPVLGGVRSVSGIRDQHGLVTATLTHDEATSVMTVTIGAAEGSDGDSVLFAGVNGRQADPPLDAVTGSASAAYSRAIDALVSQVGDPGHPCDVHYGAEIVRVLEATELSIASAKPVDL